MPTQEQILKPYISDYKCDVCGKPATHLARDLIRDTGPLDTIERFRAGDIKAGCNEHPPESKEIGISDPFGLVLGQEEKKRRAARR